MFNHQWGQGLAQIIYNLSGRIAVFSSCLLITVSARAVLPTLDQCISSGVPPAILAERPQMKFFTGHYIHVGQRNEPNYFQNVITEIKGTPIRGIVRRYAWSDLETGMGVYNLNQIREDLKIAEANSNKLFVLLQFKYRNLAGNPSVPKYIRDKGLAYYYNINNSPTGDEGTVPNFGNPYVIERFLKLMKKIAEETDSRSGMAGVTVNETAPSVSLTTSQRDSYHLGLIKVDKGISCLFRRTPFIQLTNHPMKYLEAMSLAYKAHSTGIGAPDVFSYSEDDDLYEPGFSYQYFTSLEPFVPRAALVADNNYRYRTYADEKDSDESGESFDTSVSRIFNVAHNTLKANFIFWHRAKGDDGYYLAVKSKVKNGAFLPLRSTCPSTYGGGCQH